MTKTSRWQKLKWLRSLVHQTPQLPTTSYLEPHQRTATSRSNSSLHRTMTYIMGHSSLRASLPSRTNISSSTKVQMAMVYSSSLIRQRRSSKITRIIWPSWSCTRLNLRACVLTPTSKPTQRWWQSSQKNSVVSSSLPHCNLIQFLNSTSEMRKLFLIIG